jgi:sulfoxide reductase heme-binding subunit YedZ
VAAATLAAARRTVGSLLQRGRAVPRWVYPVLFTASALPVAVILLAMWSDLARGTRWLSPNPITEAEHMTGEWTLRFLMFGLAITPLRELTGWGWLMRYRRVFGVFAFAYACVHLGLYLGVDLQFDWSDFLHDLETHPYIMVGASTFLLMVPLAFTSTKGWIKRVGGWRWKRVHWLIYPIVVLGLLHFAWGVRQDMDDPVVFASIFAVLFAYRVWRWSRHGRSVALPGAPAHRRQ